MDEDKYIEDLIQAGASDEEIVEALSLFRQRGQTAPVEEPQLQTEPTPQESPKGAYAHIGPMLSNVIGSINKGATRFIPDILKTAGAVEETVGGKGYLTQAGQAVQEGINYMNPVDPDFEQSFGGQVASGVGQIVPLVATAGLSGQASALAQAPKVGGFLGGAKILGEKLISPAGVIAGSSMAAPEWEAAKAQGLSDAEALGVAAQNYFLGLSETFPIEKGLELFKVLRTTGLSPLDYVRASGVGGMTEFIQEGFQTYMSNQIAKDSYDPDRDPLFGVLESAGVGGVVGTLIPFMGAAIANTSNPQTKAKLQEKMVAMQAAQAISESGDTGDKLLNQEIDKQTEDITKSIGNAVDESNQALTTTPVSIPSIDQTTGEDITKEGEEFAFNDPAGEAKGTIVEDAASIQEIFAATDEEGNPIKGGKLYEKVITALQDRGIKTVVVGAQSQGSQKTLDRLVEKGILSIDPKGDIKVGDQTTHTRFNITESAEESQSTKPTSQSSESQTGEIVDSKVATVNDPIRALELQAGMVTIDARGKAEPTGAMLGEELKGAERKATVVEQIADALRGKVETRGGVIDFQDNWNAKHPENQISNAEATAAWNLIKKAPKEKGPTVTAPINELLKEQIKNFYRGVEKGVRKGQKLVNEQLIPKVQQALKDTKLTPRQTSAILTKVKKTNLFTPGSFNKLNTFIDKVVGDAQYAETLAKARSLQKRVKKFGRQKSESTPISYKVLARQFSRLNPSDISSLDEYIEKANEIVGGFRPINAPNYAAPNTSNIESYIDKNLKTQEEQKEVEISGEEDVDSVDKMDQLKTIAQTSKEQLDEKDLSVFDKREQGMIDTIKKIDINQLDEDQLKRFIKIVDNIVENDDLSGEGYIEAVAKAHDFIKGFAEIQKAENAKTSKIGIWGRALYNLSNMTKRIFQNSRIEAFARAAMHGPVLQAGSQVEHALVEASKGFDDNVKRINKKYKTELRDMDNKADMMVFSLLYQMESESDMQKMHRNIRETINRHKQAGNDNEAAAWEKAYDKFKDVTSFEQAREIIEKNNPAVYEMWKFFGTDENNAGLFSDEIAKEGAKVAKEVYNREYVPTTRYTPLVQHDVNTLFKTSEAIEEGTQQSRKIRIDPTQSRTAKRRSLSLATNKVYTLEPYTDWVLRYGETIYDNKAAKAELTLSQIMRHPDFTKLIGGKENAEAMANAFKRMVAIQRGTNRIIAENETENIFTDIAKTVRTIGVVRALASTSQFLKQSTVTVKTMANLLATGDMDVFIPAVHALTSTKKEGTDPVSKLINSSTLLSRGLRMGGTDRGTSEAYKIGKGATKKFYKLLETSRVTLDKNSRRFLTALVRTDVANAKVAFLAYYMQDLKKQGVPIDLTTEYQKQDDPTRQRAMAYAENMVEQSQTASNPAALSDFQSQSQSKGWEFVKNVFLPFSTFDADFKARMVNEVSALRRSPSKETSIKLAGTIGEALTFAMVSGWWLYWYKQGIKKLIETLTGVDAPEKTEEEHDKSIKQRVITSLANSINPLAIGTIPQEAQQTAINQLGFILDNPDNLSKKEWMKQRALTFEPRDASFLKQLGGYSAGIEPIFETVDLAPKIFGSALGKPIKVVDSYGNEKMVQLNSDQEKILYLKFIVESLTLAGATEADIANAVRTIYREQLRAADKVDEAPKSKSSSLKLKTKPKTLKLKK